jgi:TPR repeat protein
MRYLNGFGTVKNIDEAKKFLRLAADKGNSAAKAQLDKL